HQRGALHHRPADLAAQRPHDRLSRQALPREHASDEERQPDGHRVQLPVSYRAAAVWSAGAVASLGVAVAAVLAGGCGDGRARARADADADADASAADASDAPAADGGGADAPIDDAADADAGPATTDAPVEGAAPAA